MAILPAPERRAQIVALGLPIVGGMLSQNVLNVVDTAMVGMLGDVALAAAGMGGFANFMAISFIMGLSAGVQAISARRLGEGRQDVLALALNGGLILALLWGIPWSALLISWAPDLFSLLIDDPRVVAEGTPYLQARLLAIVGVGINYAFRGYWNGINLPRLYMGTLILMHVVNIVLNYAFIFGHFGAPALGTTGAGVASAIATYVGSLTYLFLGWKHARSAGFLAHAPGMTTLKSLAQLSVPAGMAQFSLASGYTALMWIIGLTGTAALAAANVLLNITLVAILPGLALGFVAASLVGQALGRGDPDDAEAWGWDVVRVGIIALGALGLPMFFFPDLLLSGFLHDDTTRALAVAPLMLVGATIAVDGIGLVLMNALYGAGASRRVLVVGTVFQWCIGLPLAYLFGPILGMGLLWMWAAMLVYRGGQALVFSLIWRSRTWSRIQV